MFEFVPGKRVYFCELVIGEQVLTHELVPGAS